MLIIKESPIHGVGVFTDEPIKKGSKIYNYIGEEMTLAEFKKRYDRYATNSLNTYKMKRINRIIVAKEEPYRSENKVNFINESIDPNCILKKRHLFALRDIEAGEELTLKYPNDYFRMYHLK